LNTDIPPELAKFVPGAIGSIVALGWVPGTPMQRFLSLIGGIAASRYLSAPVVDWMSPHPESLGLAGFLIGLFGMAIIAKCYEALAQFNLSARLDKILARWGI
jgi:hypothetical protein